MPGVFDRLNKQLESKKGSGGILPHDLATLPPALRRIMRLMLREMQMSYPQLCDAIDEMPEADRLSRDELSSTLTSLTEEFWLTRIGEGEKAIYKVNLRREEGSVLAKGIWSSLNSKLKDKPRDE